MVNIMKLFKLQEMLKSKSMQELSKGDILKIKNKEEYFTFDYEINDDKGTFVHFKCPYGFGAILIRRRYLYNFFLTRNNNFVLYEKI